MTNEEARAMLRVPARDIPVPTSVSPEAQAVLAMGAMTVMDRTEYPAPDDLDGWRKRIALQDEGLLAMMGERAARISASVEERDVEGVTVYVITPDGVSPGDERVFLDIHGGALILCGGACCRAIGTISARRNRVTTWAVDYRMPPDHPYPTPLDDCVAAYRALLRERRADQIIVGGSSAGGNLVAAMLLRARDEGLPLPAAAVLVTPEVDLTESGDSFQTNMGVDTVLQSLMPVNLLYAAGHDLAHPYLSPLFGDFSKGFPPTLVAAGTRDLFLSNAVRMHRALRAAGVAAELHVLEAAPHAGFFGNAPEDAALDAEIRAFLDAHWPA